MPYLPIKRPRAPRPFSSRLLSLHDYANSTSMLKRFLTSKGTTYLETFPVVALLGARQVGKTTLAGSSWKGFVVEQVSALCDGSLVPHFFRT